MLTILTATLKAVEPALFNRFVSVGSWSVNRIVIVSLIYNDESWASNTNIKNCCASICACVVTGIFDVIHEILFPIRGLQFHGEFGVKSILIIDINGDRVFKVILDCVPIFGP